MILHLALPVQHRLSHSPILLWAEVCFTRSFDFIPVIVFTHFVHLHLLKHNFANRLFFLLALFVNRYVKAIVLLFKCFKLFLIFNFTLFCLHQVHLKAFQSITHDHINSLRFCFCRSKHCCFVSLCIKRSLLDELI